KPNALRGEGGSSSFRHSSPDERHARSMHWRTNPLVKNHAAAAKPRTAAEAAEPRRIDLASGQAPLDRQANFELSESNPLRMAALSAPTATAAAIPAVALPAPSQAVTADSAARPVLATANWSPATDTEADDEQSLVRRANPLRAK